MHNDDDHCNNYGCLLITHTSLYFWLVSSVFSSIAHGKDCTSNPAHMTIIRYKTMIIDLIFRSLNKIGKVKLRSENEVPVEISICPMR